MSGSWLNKVVPVRVGAKVAIAKAHRVPALKWRFHMTRGEDLNFSDRARVANIGIGQFFRNLSNRHFETF
jgi:hypothetical protein